MAEVTPTVKPDLSTVPNFDALDDWLAKLHSWCEEAREEVESLNELGNPEQAERIARLQSENQELEGKADSFDSLVELVLDVDRGVRDTSEAVRWLRERGFGA